MSDAPSLATETNVCWRKHVLTDTNVFLRTRADHTGVETHTNTHLQYIHLFSDAASCTKPINVLLLLPWLDIRAPV